MITMEANNLEDKNFKKILPLFWDYELDSLKKNFTSPFVIARVLELANPEQFRIFSSAIGDELIVKFIEEKGQKMLSKRSLNYWRLYYGKRADRKS